MTMKKHRFSVVLDSAFREKSVYPLPTRFVVPVNDSITTPYVSSPIAIFSWADPLQHRFGTVVGGSQSTLTLSDDLASSTPNYYMGCQLELLDGVGGQVLESCTILSYDDIQNTVTLSVPFTNSIRTYTDVRIAYPDSKANPFILQITGYNPLSIFEYQTLYLFNQSKRWVRPIQLISQMGLVNLKEPIPVDEYGYADILEVRTSPQIVQYPLVSIVSGITKYMIEPSYYDYRIGMVLYIEPDDPMTGTRQRFQVMDKDPEGGELVLKILTYGGPFVQSRTYPLIPEDDPTADVNALSSIFALQTRTIIDAGTEFIPSPLQNVIYLGQSILSEFFYFNYEIQGTYIILVDDVYPYEMVIDPDRLGASELFYGFLSKVTVNCAMNVANFSIPDNQVCTTITLDCLILPNRIVRNYNKLLSFFPYVIVRLYNVEAPQYSKYGNVTSNNPSSTNAQFICPIGNLLNPTLIKFVEVRSDMEQMLKISPYQDLLFEVLLPDGKLLEFEDEVSDISSIIGSYTFSIRDTVACLLSLTIQTPPPPSSSSSSSSS